MPDNRNDIDSAIRALGAKVREERESRKISLRGLARQLDISPSHLSLFERGRLRPSVETLWRIVSALDLSLDYLLTHADGGPEQAAAETEAGEAPSPVQKHDARKSIGLAHGVSWQRLTPGPDHDVDFVHVVYEVGAESSPKQEQYRHSGKEYGYIISGRLCIAIGSDEYVLGPGDSISFDARTPHRQWAVGDEPVHAIWFIYHPERKGEKSETETSRYLGLT